MVFMEAHAVIRKLDIAVAEAFRGYRNSLPMTIGGMEYPASALVFCGFYGALNIGDGLYHGVYRYRASGGSDDESSMFDPNELPDAESLPASEPVSQNEPDVLKEDVSYGV